MFVSERYLLEKIFFIREEKIFFIREKYYLEKDIY